MAKLDPKRARQFASELKSLLYRFDLLADNWPVEYDFEPGDPEEVAYVVIHLPEMEAEEVS